MKNILKVLFTVIILALLVSAGYAETLDDYYYTVTFGEYEQDNNSENGKEPIEWYILERNDTGVVLLSKYALDCKPYHSTKDEEITWQTCTLRRWLNGAFFLNAFSDAEKEMIVLFDNTNSKTDGNPKFEDTIGGRTTSDQVYLLSFAECNEFIESDYECYSTEYAKAQGLKTKTPWWLRSPGKKQTEASACSKSHIDSTLATKDTVGIRPVIRLDLSVAHTEGPLDIYINGLDAYTDEDYKTGMILFDSLGDYHDAYEMTALCKLCYAVETLETDNEETLIRLQDYDDYALNNVGYYFDEYYEFLTAARYSAALERQNNGDYNGALDLFYSQSYYNLDDILDCFAKLNIQYHWMTKDTSAVNAGNNDEYSKTDEITSKDPHFGWSLGRFLISGYTEYLDNANSPILIKTPGDDIRLLFVVDQDIDALNGNEKLTIEENEKGSDRQFQIPKMNFGRGALIIYHEKPNGDSEIIPYFDYLFALAYEIDDTAVEIKEEGKYKVALDYRVQEGTVFSDHNDYRIYFEFEVKNGSGMSYLFDTETGAELTDYSITNDGFRIDLANSNSLSINVTRYAINAAENGLDVRSTAPAADGETYNKTGYYEISTTNKETGEVITKHLFVGRSTDLEDFIDADAALEAFIGG